MLARTHQLNGVSAAAAAIAATYAVHLAQQADGRLRGFGLMTAVTLACLLAMALNRRRLSAIDDTPTSKVASAAQGYVELMGRAQQMDGQVVLSPLSHLPCLWYHYVAERKDKNNRSLIGHEKRETGTSDANFLLVDSSGKCVVDPVGSEIHSTHFQSWCIGDWLYREWLLLANDPLYAIGQFKSVRPTEQPRAVRNDISATLVEWKQNRSELLRRFDSNGDGNLDEEEWERVRLAAEQQVMSHYRSEDAHEGYKLLTSPKDGRPFIIANTDPARLTRAFRVWAWIHVAGCLCSVGALIWIVRH